MASKDCGNRARGLDPFILPLTQFNIHTSTCTSQNPNSLSLTYPGNLWCPHKNLFKGTDTFGVVPWKESLPWRKKNKLSLPALMRLFCKRWGGVGEWLWWHPLLNSFHHTECKPWVTTLLISSEAVIFLSFSWLKVAMKGSLLNRCVKKTHKTGIHEAFI